MPRHRPGATAQSSNVIPIRGRVLPLCCPQCGGSQVVQVDLIECVYPVHGVQKPGVRVLVDLDRREYDHEAIADQFYRCGGCAAEWPLAPGTVFLDVDGER